MSNPLVLQFPARSQQPPLHDVGLQLPPPVPGPGLASSPDPDPLPELPEPAPLLLLVVVDPVGSYEGEFASPPSSPLDTATPPSPDPNPSPTPVPSSMLAPVAHAPAASNAPKAEAL
jgi:hypothetical protein